MIEEVALKIGDVVYLKSGSPRMTITEIEGDEVTCVWMPFIGPWDVKTHKFKKAALRLR